MSMMPAQFKAVIPALVAMFAVSATFSLYNFALFERVMVAGWDNSFITLVFNGCFLCCILGFIGLLFRPMIVMNHRLMISCTAAIGAGTCLLFSFSEVKALWVCFFLVQGAFSVLWHQNVRLTLIENAREGEYARVFSLYAVSHISGNLFGAFMFPRLGGGVGVTGLILACYAGAVLALAFYPRVQPVFKGHAVPRLRRYVNIVKASPVVWLVCLCSGYIGETYFNFFSTFMKSLGLDAGQALTALTCFMCGGVLAKYPLAWLMDRYGGLKVTLIISSFSVAFNAGLLFRWVPLIALAASILNISMMLEGQGVALLYGLAALTGGALCALTLAGDTVVTSSVPKREHQEAVTLSILVYFLGGLLGNSIVGPAMDQISPQAFPVISIGIVALMMVGLLALRQVMGGRAEPASP